MAHIKIEVDEPKAEKTRFRRLPEELKKAEAKHPGKRFKGTFMEKHNERWRRHIVYVCPIHGEQHPYFHNVERGGGVCPQCSKKHAGAVNA